MNNTTNNDNRKLIIHPRRKSNFFKLWLFLGIVLMLLNATIWPEVSTDPNIRWFYQVATLWITMVNKVCQHLLPVLQTVGEWLTNLVINIFEWLGENWPTIINMAHKWLQFCISTTLNLFVFLSFIIILCIISIAITYLLNRENGKQMINDIIRDIKDEWNRTFRHKVPEGEAISKTPTAGNSETGSVSNENGAE